MQFLHLLCLNKIIPILNGTTIFMVLAREQYICICWYDVQVYCRIRPPGAEDEECCVEMISSSTIQLHPPDGLKANRNGEYKEVSVSVFV